MSQPVFPKFIIEENRMILGKCTFHHQLATDPKKVKGGGWFTFDLATKTFTLSEDSHQFGAAKIEDIKACIEANEVYASKYMHRKHEGCKFVFQTKTKELIPLN